MNLPTYITGTVQTKAYRLLRTYVYDALSQYDLNPSSWAMLGSVLQARDGARKSDIARAMHVKPPFVTVISNALQERGLIRSVPSQFDGRIILLAITPEGKKFIKTVEQALNKQLEQLLSGLTEDDLMTYHKVLTTIIANDEKQF
jgi:DNA-binding MarR family transcriptional regulator